jgi:hypothetical protein
MQHLNRFRSRYLIVGAALAAAALAACAGDNATSAALRAIRSQTGGSANGSIAGSPGPSPTNPTTIGGTVDGVGGGSGSPSPGTSGSPGTGTGNASSSPGASSPTPTPTQFVATQPPTPQPPPPVFAAGVEVKPASSSINLASEDSSNDAGYPTTVKLVAEVTLNRTGDASNYPMQWRSSDVTIATVDSTGLVTAGTKPGSAVITAVAQDANAVEGTASVTVLEDSALDVTIK